VAKRYRARTRHPVDAPQLERLQQGVELHGEPAVYLAEDLQLLDTHTLEFSIRQGIYHQVRRMIAASGNRCETLHRIQIGSVLLGDLPEGQWRYLATDEVASLMS
jgi:16S rRNA pseudouridine516 synthase